MKVKVKGSMSTGYDSRSDMEEGVGDARDLWRKLSIGGFREKEETGPRVSAKSFGLK